MARTTAGPRTPEPDIYKSLGLQALCRRMGDRTECSILELGSALGVNIEFWSRFGPHIHIVNLQENMPAANYAADGTMIEPDWEGILCVPDKTRFDVILAWDLFNYFEQPLIAGLVRRLSEFSLSDALLFALIYDRQQMPAAPTIFKIVDEEHLIYQSRTTESRACPRHQPRDVQRMLAGFRTASSFQLRHGVQEYLFEYHPESRE